MYIEAFRDGIKATAKKEIKLKLDIGVSEDVGITGKRCKGMVNKMVYNKITMVIIISILLLCSVRIVESQEFNTDLFAQYESDYPINHETKNELSRLLEKFFDLEQDIASIDTQEEHDLMMRTGLQLYLAKLEAPAGGINLLLTLEETHGLHPPYNLDTLSVIDGAITIGIHIYDHISELTDDLMIHEFKFNSVNHHSFIILLDKLKEYACESKGLMQKIMNELEETAKKLGE